MIYPYLILTKVPLTFLVFIGSADPVPKKTTAGYSSAFPAQENTPTPLYNRKSVSKNKMGVALIDQIKLTRKRCGIGRAKLPAFLHFLQKVWNLRSLFHKLLGVAGGDGVSNK